MDPQIPQLWTLRSPVPGYRRVEAGQRFSLAQEPGVTILHCEVRSRPQVNII